MTVQANMVGLPVLDRQAIVGIPATGLTATGSSQGTALALPSDLNIFTTVGSNTGAILPFGVDGTTPGPVQFGDEITIINHGANALLVYPQSGGKIQNGSANASFSVTNTKTAFFVYVGSGNWAAALGS